MPRDCHVAASGVPLAWARVLCVGMKSDNDPSRHGQTFGSIPKVIELEGKVYKCTMKYMLISSCLCSSVAKDRHQSKHRIEQGDRVCYKPALIIHVQQYDKHFGSAEGSP